MSELGLNMTGGDEPSGKAPKPPGTKSRAGVVIAMVVVAAVIVGGGFFLYSQFFKPAPSYAGSGNGTEVTFVVTSGETISQMGNALEKDGIVASAAGFIDVASSDSRAKGIQAGTYTMQKEMSAQSAFDVLADAKNAGANRISIPEGSNAEQVAVIAAEKTGIPLADFKALIKDPSGLGLPSYAQGEVEGFLYPSSYDYTKNSTAKSIFKAMVDKFKVVAEEIGLEKGAAAIGRSPHDIVVVASIEEKEAYEAYFAQVAGVIYNRVDCTLPVCKTEYIKGRLNSDAIVNYGLGTSDEQLTKAQRDEDTPYNSYIHSGLPPTPISNPARAALLGALNPTVSKDLYFVSIPGTDQMLFAENNAQHLKNVKVMNDAYAAQGNP